MANVMRYPSRRAFFELIAASDYLRIMPWKLAALEASLTPVANEVTLPNLRLALVWLFVMLFLAVGWWRVARRAISLTTWGARAVAQPASTLRYVGQVAQSLAGQSAPTACTGYAHH